MVPLTGARIARPAELNYGPELEGEKMKHILYLAAATIALCLMTPAAYAQRSDLDLRFHAPFPFSVESNTFAAGDYVVTREGHLELIFCNQENHVVALVSVLPARPSKEGNGHARLVFHRYDDQYFLALVSEGSPGSTFGVYTSKQETQLANASPQKPMAIVSLVPSRGTQQATARFQK
jgi:hypothetical protein